MTEIMEPVETREDLRARLARDVRQIYDQLFRLEGVPGDKMPVESTAWQLAHLLANLLDEGVASEDAKGWRYNAKNLSLLASSVPILRKHTERE